MSYDFKQAVLKYIQYMKEGGYDIETSHESLLCKVNNIVAVSLDRKIKAKESGTCDLCDEWINIDDAQLYYVSIIKREPFRDQELKIMTEHVCKQCL
jgi:hypothetical protein